MKKLTIGILGLGVVGKGVVELLTKQHALLKQKSGVDLQVVKAFVRNPAEKAAFAKQYNLQLTEDPQAVLADPSIDIIVEVMGKIDPAKDYIATALKNGKHVVTANKDLLALHGKELMDLAQEQGRFLYYEASVAGGIPILRTLQHAYLADDITEIWGIINGTTNYMLTQMEETKVSYEESLKDAQQKGFAESDPTNDVDGFDSGYKTILLAAFAFGTSLEMSDVSIEGIRDIDAEDIQLAKKAGYQVKLIGRAKKSGNTISAEVAPMLVPHSHPLAAVRNEYNAVYIKSSGMGNTMYYGAGAGAGPTATSVLNDLATIAQNLQTNLPAEPFYKLTEEKWKAGTDSTPARYYAAFEFSKLSDVSGKLQQLLEEAGLFAPGTLLVSSSNTRIALLTAPIFKEQLELFTRKNPSYPIARIMKIMEE